MPNVFVIDLESVPSRYTYYWKKHLPNMIYKHTTAVAVPNIDGGQESIEATEGAFLNFNMTNIYKSEQVKQFANLMDAGIVGDGDVVLFADAWNPAILNIRYMIDLAGLDVELHGIWHAGSYDPQDFLGRNIKNKSWSYSAETAFFHALDKSYFATHFHSQLFTDTITQAKGSHKLHRTGLPMEYIETLAQDYYPLEKLVDRKENLICFPHRIAPEKNVDLFKDVMSYLPEYDYIICQEHNLIKKEYYDVLSRSAIVFSANKQETLGIGVFEGMMFGCKPVVPDRLSYAEMYPDKYKYSNNLNAEDIATFIYDLDNSTTEKEVIRDSSDVFDNFFTGTLMYREIDKSLRR